MSGDFEPKTPAAIGSCGRPQLLSQGLAQKKYPACWIALQLTRMERALKWPMSANSASAPVTHSRMLPSPFQASWLRPCNRRTHESRQTMRQGHGSVATWGSPRTSSVQGARRCLARPPTSRCSQRSVLLTLPHASPTLPAHRPVIVHIMWRERLERCSAMLGDVPRADGRIGQEPQKHDGAALGDESHTRMSSTGARCVAQTRQAGTHVACSLCLKLKDVLSGRT